MIYHEEPVYRNGVIVGSTTSGAFGHRVGRSLGLAYVKNEAGVSKPTGSPAGHGKSNWRGRNTSAKVQFAPFYDPKGERIKA
jgi:glycine cleavage system aminomethyltransferase T